MENSPYTERTLEIFETLWEQGYRNLGVALQAYLYRTERDVRRMNELGARVRLVKGAYKEPAAVAYQKKAEVSARSSGWRGMLLDHGTYPGHRHARSRGASSRSAPTRRSARFRTTGSSSRCSTASGATYRCRWSAQGHRVRVYVPFGREWFPYFMRRLGERPANVAFVIRGADPRGLSRPTSAVRDPAVTHPMCAELLFTHSHRPRTTTMDFGAQPVQTSAIRWHCS